MFFGGHMRDQLFQSTLSMRRATGIIGHMFSVFQISIHALHEESDAGGIVAVNTHAISIHALHEESDGVHRLMHNLAVDFNPRSP